MLYWRRLNRHLNVDGLPAIAVFNIVLLHMELVWPAIAILKSSRYTNYSFYYYYGFFITYNYLFFFLLVLSGDWNISSLLNLSPCLTLRSSWSVGQMVRWSVSIGNWMASFPTHILPTMTDFVSTILKISHEKFEKKKYDRGASEHRCISRQTYSRCHNKYIRVYCSCLLLVLEEGRWCWWWALPICFYTLHC